MQISNPNKIEADDIATQPRLSPNPASNNLYIHLPNNDDTNDVAIELINSLGVSVLNVKNSNRINVENLPNGLYLIKIIQGKNTYLSSCIKH